MDLRDLGGLSPLWVAPLGKQGVFWTLLVSFVGVWIITHSLDFPLYKLYLNFFQILWKIIYSNKL